MRCSPGISLLNRASPMGFLNSRLRAFVTDKVLLHAAFTPALYSVLSRGQPGVRLLAGAASDQTETPTGELEELKQVEPVVEPVPQLQLNTGGFIIPHPQKVAKGGEDAFFIATNQRAFGVADGVGGWADAGIDPGNFSRNLMREARKASEAACSTSNDAPLDSFQILCTALSNSLHIIGSSTACIVCLNGTKLLATNIGDSGLLVIRDGKLIASTPSQQHRFNFPYQIGTKGNPVTAAENFVIPLEAGDILVAGTDGLFDNVFPHRTTKIVWDAKKHGVLPGVAAQQLATFASARSMDPVYLSPFAKAAAQAGFFYRGGKVDDITVVVSYVSHSKGELGMSPTSSTSSHNSSSGFIDGMVADTASHGRTEKRVQPGTRAASALLRLAEMSRQSKM